MPLTSSWSGLRPKATYARMLADLRGEERYTKRAPLYPYIYERLWKRVFACKG